MRKLIAVISILLSLIIFPQMVIAADVLYRMLHADEVEQFREDQDAFIVGQLTGMQEGSFNVKVLKVISGKVSSDTIRVANEFTYGWNKELPAVNDFAVFSLKKQSGNLYKKAWGIFKANNGDFKTLKLMEINAPSPGLMADLACIQWYINSGGKENDFYFPEGKAFIRHSNGQDEQIYPPLTDKSQTTSAIQAEKINTSLTGNNLSAATGNNNLVIPPKVKTVQEVDKSKMSRIFLLIVPVLLMLFISGVTKKKK